MNIIGRAMNLAMLSAFDMPRRFGTSSPMTKVKYVTNITMTALEST